MGMTEVKKLDARGLFCPEPVFKTNIELAKMQTGETLLVLVDDPMAEIDMKDYCSKHGYEVLDMKKTDNDFEFTIKKSR
jgi:TusA-related sulfurtransferase